MKNIHILPTDKPSSLYILGKNELKLRYIIDLPIDPDIVVNQQIYITSDEEIKKGDWFIANNRVHKCIRVDNNTSCPFITLNSKKEEIGHFKTWRTRIILTTDQDLISDGIQAIDDEFLEWIVKNPSCEEVEVMNVPDFIYETKHSCYKIIIPKEEQNTMKNIHILPTDKPSRLYYHNDDKLRFISDNVLFTTNQNIYITSDEEIKEGVWHLVWLRDKWEVLNYMPSIGYRKECLGKEVCKIILTTDQDLIKDGVQAIDDEFLQWIVKNPSCEEVEIQKVYNDYGETDIFDLVCTPHSFNYKIIIPKEEQNTMKNIHIIPTDKPSRLYDDGLELYLLIKASNSNNDLISYKNIYITSDEEIKEGDYMLLKYEHSHGRIRKCHYIYEEQLMIDAKEDIGFGFCKRNEVYKIILTTDQDLIKDGIQAISTEFLEWFVKNPSCEEVDVDILWNDDENFTHDSYEIIIPSEEPLPKVKIDWSNFPKSTQEKVGYIEPKQKIDMSKYTMGIDPYDEQETVEEDFKIWDDLFGILAWKFKPTKSGDMYLDGEKVYEELKSKFKLKRI